MDVEEAERHEENTSEDFYEEWAILNKSDGEEIDDGYHKTDTLDAILEYSPSSGSDSIEEDIKMATDEEHPEVAVEPPADEHKIVVQNDPPPGQLQKRSMKILLIPLDELELFAKAFKRRRIQLGASQGEVACVMAKLYEDISATAISRFEALNLSYKYMCRLMPILQLCLDDEDKRQLTH